MPYLAVIPFAIVASITPGPNNFLLLASAARFGFRRTIPHMMGVNLGFAFMLVANGFGAMAMLQALPGAFMVLRVVLLGYLLYLAFRIATAPTSDEIKGGKTGDRPFTFLEAAAFQWINPKAWTMSMGAVTTFLPEDPGLFSAVALAAVFAVFNFPCILTWTVGGRYLGELLRTPRRRRIFNVAAAVTLLAAVVPSI